MMRQRRSIVAISASLIVVGCRLGPQPRQVEPSAGSFEPAQLGELTAVHGQLPRPYESVCRSMTSRRYVGLVRFNFVSSGGLLDDDLLVTAGHNYASPHSPWSVLADRSVECGAGVDGQSPWFTVYGGYDRGRQVRNPPETHGTDWAHDYALVALGRAAPRKSSFRLPRPGEKLVTGDSIVFVAGFPAESIGNGSQMMHARAKVDSVVSSVLYYRLQSERGLSGAPVWIERGGEFILVGIHVADHKAHAIDSITVSNLEKWRQGLRP